MFPHGRRVLKDHDERAFGIGVSMRRNSTNFKKHSNATTAGMTGARPRP
jgi:hypothetical protein